MKDTFVCKSCIQLIDGIPVESEKTGFVLGHDDQGRKGIYLHVPLEQRTLIRRIKQASLCLVPSNTELQQLKGLEYQIVPTNQVVNSNSKNDIVPFIWNQPEYVKTASEENGILAIDILELVKLWIRSPRKNGGMVLELSSDREFILLGAEKNEQDFPYIQVQYIENKRKEKVKESRNIGSIKGITQF